MTLLRSHFSGAGNSTRRVAAVEHMKDTLHYRNERSLTFEVFLSKCQRMFNIYEQQKEPMTEDAKVRFLLKKTLHPQLANAVETIQSQLSLNPGTVTVATVSNFLASRVSDLPDYVSRQRNVNAIGSENNTNTAPNTGVVLSDGSIWTGYYPNWQKLSKEEKDKVTAERKSKGTSAGTGG